MAAIVRVQPRSQGTRLSARAMIGYLAVRNPPVNAHGRYSFSSHGFCSQNLANLVTYAERNFVQKQEIEQNTYLFLTMSSKDDFF